MAHLDNCDDIYEELIKTDWKLKKIVKLKDKKVRYYVFKRDTTEIYEYYKSIPEEWYKPKTIKEIELKELYCKFSCINNESYKRIIDNEKKQRRLVEEVEVTLNWDEREIENLLKV